VEELIKRNIPQIEVVVLHLFRNISGGDVSAPNIQLTRNMLDICERHVSFITKFHGLISTTVYSFLRLLLDHHQQIAGDLRKREIDYCVKLIRQNVSLFQSNFSFLNALTLEEI
jgi:integrator complex subunit 3